MLRVLGSGLGPAAVPAAAPASGVPLPTCEDLGTGRLSLLFGRQADRFVHFLEGRADAPEGLAVHASRRAIADCRGGWRLSAPADDDPAHAVMDEVFFGAEAYDRRGILRLARARAVTLRAEPFDEGHCTCRVDPAGEGHWVDD